MQRLSIACTRVRPSNGGTVVRLTRSQHARRLTTEVNPSQTSNSAFPPTPKKRARRFVRQTLFYSSVVLFTVYGLGTIAALRNERFHDFFVEFVPYGERIIDTADQYGWEGHPVEPQAVLEAGKAAVEKLEHAANTSVSSTQAMIERAKTEAQESSKHVGEEAAKLFATAETSRTKTGQSTQVSEDIRETPDNPLKDDAELVTEAENARKEDGQSPLLSVQPEESGTVSLEKPIYTGQLPLGFEPPPGFTLPEKSKHGSEVPAPSTADALPLIAPALTTFSSSEPVLAQLAGTIDNLAAFVKDNPSSSRKSNMKEILDTARTDLVQLAERLQHMKEDEKAGLEDKLEEQAREYSVQLLQLEMDAQDKLDLQEEDWRKYYDEERQRVIQDYRAKLAAELQMQTEIINERLKEEVIAQGIELQRRWIREIKIRVEEERGGRLAKLDELAADLKRLSRVTLDNSAYLDENLRLHALWSSIRAVNAVVQDCQLRKPFREELRVLRHVAIAGGASEDPVLAVALETLESSDVPDTGIEPFADLASWFTTSVVPRVSAVALVPDQNAGVLSYLASSLLSSFRFKRQGFVEGDNVLSVLARAEYYMNEKDLDSATRELNQLKGPAKVLLSDWLDAARKRLAVLQAIEVVQSQATLLSLLLV